MFKHNKNRLKTAFEKRQQICGTVFFIMLMIIGSVDFGTNILAFIITDGICFTIMAICFAIGKLYEVKNEINRKKD